MTLYSAIVIAIVVIMFVLRLWLSILNFQYRNQPVADNVKHIYTPERYSKWLNYTMDNFRFGLLTKGVSLFVIIILLLTGGFALIANWTQSLTGSDLLAQLLFFAVLIIGSQLIDTPFEYYQTFVIEEKYGFNKTTKKTFFLDIVKNILVASILGGALLSGLFWLVNLFADQFVLLVAGIWLALAAVMVLLSMFNGVLVRVFNKLTPLPEGSLRERIESMASGVGFRLRRIFVMDASSRSTKLNAFFTGLGRTKEIVLFDTLIEKLSEEEVLSVMAHEIAHSVHKDVHRMLLESVIIFGVYASLLGFIFQTSEFALAFGFEQAHFGFNLVLFYVLISPVSFLVNLPRMYFSRKAEFKADAYSATKIDKQHMISALTVLARESLSNLSPHPLFVKLYYSHPPMSERLSALEKVPALTSHA
jgi:STE24 endopeptidase